MRNNLGQNNHWIAFELQGTKSNRDSIGAKITVLSANQKLTRWITGGGSYLSSHDKRVVVGLANDSRSVSVDIRWPSGAAQHLPDLKLDRYHKIVEPNVPIHPRL